MWTPTHVQVTVNRARNLIPKGKQGTNDVYVTIQLGKEKYQTSVKERSENPEWHEECELPLGNMEQDVVLTAYHRNLMSLDEFLGTAALPLSQFHIYERPKSRWYPLANKPGSKKPAKYRGEIEVKFTFLVHSCDVTEQGSKTGSLKRSREEKQQAKLEKGKSKDADELIKEIQRTSSDGTLKQASGARLGSRRHSLNVEALTALARGASPVRQGSPASAERKPTRLLAVSDKRRHSMHPEILPTVPTIDVEPSRDPPSTLSASSSTSSLTRSDQSLHKQGSGRSSKASSEFKPTITEEPQQEGETAENAGESSQFSRSNSFRQAIGRGSLRRGSGKRGSVDARSSQASDDISGFLTGGDTMTSSSADTSRAESDSAFSAPNGGGGSLGGGGAAFSHLKTSTLGSSSSSMHERVSEEEDNDLDSSSSRDSAPRHVIASPTVQAVNETNLYHTLESGRRGARRAVAAHKIADTHAEQQRSQRANSSMILSNEVLDQFKQFSREELVEMVLSTRQDCARMRKEKRDLEDYIDSLLVRVMESQPLLLQNPRAPQRPYSQVDLITGPPPAYPGNRARSPPKQLRPGAKKSGLFKRLSAAFK